MEPGSVPILNLIFDESGFCMRVVLDENCLSQYVSAYLANEQVPTAQQILFRGVMTPTLFPVWPGLHLSDVGLL